MKICKKCNKSFPAKTWIDGKEVFLHTRSYCLECSPRGSRNGYDLRKENTKNSDVCKTGFVICPICDKPIKVKDSKHGTNAVCSTCRGLYYRFQKKQEAVDLLGGKCQKCGECDIDLLTFHHINEVEKNFNISQNYGIKQWEIVKQEIVKCELLCHNCHMKLHKLEHKEKLQKIIEYYEGRVLELVDNSDLKSDAG